MRRLFRRRAPLAGAAGKPCVRVLAAAAAVVTLVAGAAAMMYPPPPTWRTLSKPASNAASSATAYRQIVLPDLLLVAPHGLSAAQITRLGKLPGVRNVITADGAAIKVGDRQANVLGVDPQQFRSWTPLATASDQSLWTALAEGRFVAAQDAAHRLGLRSGVRYGLTGAARQDLVFGGSAPLGVSGIDVLVSNRASGALGLVRGHRGQPAQRAVAACAADRARRQARQLPATVPAVGRLVLPGAVLDGARRHRPDRERRREQHGPVQRWRARAHAVPAVHLGDVGHHGLRGAGPAEHYGPLRRCPLGGPVPVRGRRGHSGWPGRRHLRLQPCHLVRDRGARPGPAVRADLRLTGRPPGPGLPGVPGWMVSCRTTTRSCSSPSVDRKVPMTSCRSWRTSPGAARYRANGSPRWPSTTTRPAGSARSTSSAGTCSPLSARTSRRPASTCPSTGATGTGILISPRPSGTWPLLGCAARSR